MKGNIFRLSHILAAIVLVGLWAYPCSAESGSDPGSAKARNSYSLGYHFGSNIGKQSVDFDLNAVIAGLRDGYEHKQPKLSQEEMKKIIEHLNREIWVTKQMKFRQQAAENLKKGEAFLAENAKKPGVVTLPSGLQYKVLKKGSGSPPHAGDTVEVQYRGRFIDGTEFDSSYRRGEPASFRVDGVIKGWTEALQLMPAGSAWQIFVPAKLAYGNRRYGRIPANSTLIFEIKLVSIAEAVGSNTDKPKPGAESGG
jgi:FKBP-type peptidyl-prolyl cis-trans isomerase FklB